MSKHRSLLSPTILWCSAGVALAAFLWDGAPDRGTPHTSSTADAQWTNGLVPVIARPRHSLFP